MKTGLIMEGGAMRGMFTCGVIDVMQEAGITLMGQSAYRQELCLDVIISRNRLGEPIGIRGSIAKITDTEA